MKTDCRKIYPSNECRLKDSHLSKYSDNYFKFFVAYIPKQKYSEESKTDGYNLIQFRNDHGDQYNQRNF